MKTVLVLLLAVAYCSATGIVGIGLGTVGLGLGSVGIARIHDDGQWRPALDNSVLGSGAIQWLGADLDDGQWRPHLDNSLAGVSPLSSVLLRHRRSLGLINPNSLPVPLDEVHTANLKAAQIIQQNSEGTRNILGGGVPLNLPADTHEVAIGKQAHAIADLRQKAIINSVRAATPAARIAVAPAAVAAPIAAPIGIAGLGVAGIAAAPVAAGVVGVPGIIGAPGIVGVHGLGVAGIGSLGLAGLRGHW